MFYHQSDWPATSQRVSSSQCPLWLLLAWLPHICWTMCFDKICLDNNHILHSLLPLPTSALPSTSCAQSGTTATFRPSDWFQFHYMNAFYWHLLNYYEYYHYYHYHYCVVTVVIIIIIFCLCLSIYLYIYLFIYFSCLCLSAVAFCQAV